MAIAKGSGKDVKEPPPFILRKKPGFVTARRCIEQDNRILDGPRQIGFGGNPIRCPRVTVLEDTPIESLLCIVGCDQRHVFS
jgi:hypothetical protein